MPKGIARYLGGIQWVLIAVLFVLSVFHIFKPVPSNVVTFDKARVVSKFIAELSAHHVSDEVIKQKSAQFGRALKETLNNYATTHHVLVMDKSQVLVSNCDRTDDIAARLASAMRDKL
ncbi:MAG: TrbI F-type domain-containing protein [Legionellaceae bacterium]|nr:TrbI F-type domain-containing protein [Legionellaceae bacterium]